MWRQIVRWFGHSDPPPSSDVLMSSDPTPEPSTEESDVEFEMPVLRAHLAFPARIAERLYDSVPGVVDFSDPLEFFEKPLRAHLDFGHDRPQPRHQSSEKVDRSEERPPSILKRPTFSPERMNFLEEAPLTLEITALSKQTFRKPPSVSFMTPRITREKSTDFSDEEVVAGDQKPIGILKPTISRDDFPDTPNPRQSEKDRMLREKRSIGRTLDFVPITEADELLADFF
jgi:hypothetical protein